MMFKALTVPSKLYLSRFKEVLQLTRLKKTLLIVLVAVFLLGCALPLFAGDLNSLKTTQDKFSFSQDDLRKQLKKKYEFDYKPYLKGEKKLGIKPNKQLYQRIYYTISFKFVKSVDNNTLMKGVIAEVRKLLAQAKVSSAKLDAMPRKGIPMEEIVELYGDKIDPDIIRYACIRGMLEALDDPHSVLMLPDDYDKLKESMSGGNFSGIGVFIMADPDNYNWLTVSDPIEGTPAYEAGLQPGDVITAVDGKSTKDEPIDVTVTRIRGAEGSPVVLTIKRKGVEKPFDVKIVRKFIHVSSVESRLLDDSVGYIKLRIYGSETGDEIEQALTKLEKQGAKAIILDVRNNSGGLIDSAQDVCSKFMPLGSPVVSVVNRANSKRVMRATGGNHSNMPMVLLINELSASASEITAGALKDSGRAVLIGARTFGKGSVQELTPLYIPGNDKPAALKLTIALFYTPKGIKINGEGLKPDIVVPLDIRDTGLRNINKDKQLKKALEYLKAKI